MKLIVGLGNPGAKYNGTRHNAGFDAVRILAKRWGLPDFSKKLYGALLTDGQIKHEKCILAMPQTYMNRSGQPVASIMGYYKLAPNDVIVVHDELSIEFGDVRCKDGGGHGGHNGLRDIIRHIGNAFLRVRYGIGRPPEQWDPAKFVLAKWTTKEKSYTSIIEDEVADAIESIVSNGIDHAMNDFNGRLNLIQTPIPN